MPITDSKSPSVADVAVCLYRLYCDEVPSTQFQRITTVLLTFATITLVLVSGTQALMRDDVGRLDRAIEISSPHPGQKADLNYIWTRSERSRVILQMAKEWLVALIGVPAVIILLLLFSVAVSRRHANRRADAERRAKLILSITTLDDNFRIERYAGEFVLTGTPIAKAPNLMGSFEEIRVAVAELEFIPLATVVPAIRKRFSGNCTGM